MATRTTTKTATTAKASQATKVSQANAVTIKSRSLTVGVPRQSSFTAITKQLEKQLKAAGCQRCLSGLDRLILDARVNPQ